jgi:hypothetical protein
MRQSEEEMRRIVGGLRPGDRVAVDHEVKVGSDVWHATTEGTVVRAERRRHSLHFRRHFDDKVYSDVVVLVHDDGERTAVTIDEFTSVRLLAAATSPQSSPAGPAPPAP